MEGLDKARAMKCFGELVEAVELDPDHNAQDKLTEEYNCKNCSSYKYCCQLADTLKHEAKEIKVEEYPETHQNGVISIENMHLHMFSSDTNVDGTPLPDNQYIKGDFGIQIARDGRVWLCINGIAFLRFSPHPDGKMRRTKNVS
jgi:hypothetical protein